MLIKKNDEPEGAWCDDDVQDKNRKHDDGDYENQKDPESLAEAVTASCAEALLRRNGVVWSRLGISHVWRGQENSNERN